MRNFCEVSLLVLLLLVTESYSVETVREVVEINTSASFDCIVGAVEYTTWSFLRRGQSSGGSIIVQRDQPNDKQKYTVTTVTNPENTVTMTLEVILADEETEGQYSCQEQGNDRLIGDLIVEIPPQLMLKKDGVELNESMDVVFTEEVQFQCVAAEGKPSVSLSWQVNGEDKTAGVTTDMSREDERIISSMINYIPNKDDETLSCITSGQEVIPSKRATVSINVMYAPSCNILVTNETSNQFRVICACDANPVVSGYKIWVNASLYREAEEVLLPSTASAIVSCSAFNEVGTGTSKEMELEPFHVDQPPSTTRVALIVAIPAVFIVLVIVIVLLVVCKKARKTTEWKGDTDHSLKLAMSMPPPPEGDLPDSEMLVQDDSKVAAPEPPEEDQSDSQMLVQDDSKVAAPEPPEEDQSDSQMLVQNDSKVAAPEPPEEDQSDSQENKPLVEVVS